MKNRTLQLLIGSVFCSLALGTQAAPPPIPDIRNVIILIPDGMSVGGTTLARWVQGGKPLALDEMAAGLVRTYNADTPIGDSAPAGSAFATGFKSQTGNVAVLPAKVGMPGVPATPKNEVHRPVATILEAARLAGKSTGLVATSEIMHATPADFSAHDPSRKAYDNLSEQQVYNRIDVVFGGGYRYLLAENRKDREDMIGSLKEQGYAIVNTPAEMASLKRDKVWGLFAAKDMKYELDRDPAKEPSLAEMTRKAIELLSKNPNGFFLMVEGSKIDWAAHANDPAGIVSDVLAFDRAVAEALAFARKDGHTAVFALSDHGNSGITMGNQTTSKSYDKEPLFVFVEPLRRARLTGEGIGLKLNKDRSNVREVIAEEWGIDDLSDEEVASVVKAKAADINYATGPILARRAKIGFTTNGHTGEDVVWYAWTPKRTHPTGVIENTDVAKTMARHLGLDLEKATSTLYVEAESAFAKAGAQTSVDHSDANNPVLVVRKNGQEWRFPQNKNHALSNGMKIDLPGVMVMSGKRWYLSKAAVELVE
ncbi:alkaline phosphatase [Formivibrio citricus]|uniref:Alkaline phosphatase n=1 Tax=Formivibrio citricus TaxID=83765 RepID=A0A1I4VUJ8_9NEIS|nr:alkaline phosphatase [Formivibrio citricus]SFN05018.1 alkaline phosphatase [Formivibrio citricus]